jgi:hypothetical protein
MKTKIITILVLTILTLTSVSLPDFTEESFAVSDAAYEYTGSDIVGSDGVSYASSVYKIFNLGRKIGIMFAVLGLALSGFRCVFGGEEAFERERKRIIILLTIGVTLFAVPYALKLGISIGQKYGWKPH